MSDEDGGRHLSSEITAGLRVCKKALKSLHRIFAEEDKAKPGNRPNFALFNAVRGSMLIAVGYLHHATDGRLTDETFRDTLHALLDKAIEDFQFNERRRTAGESQ